MIGVAGSGEGEAPESSDVKTQGESEVAQSDNASAEKVSTDQTKEEQKEEEEEKNDVPTEYKSALKRAKNYSDMMHMSKQGLYNQLISEYGEKFTAEEAQYAVDNLEVDYNENALKCAKNYQETMSMSPAAIYDQLVSEYGEKFTPEEAQYAIDNLE